MRFIFILVSFMAVIALTSCSSPNEAGKQAKSPEPDRGSLGPVGKQETSTFTAPGGKTMEIKMETGIKDTEVGLPRYPAVKRFIGPSSYSKRSGPVSTDYELDFETVDSMPEVEKFFSGSFQVLSRQSGAERISIAGKGKDGTTYSVTATRPSSSLLTQVNIRAFRKK